MLDWLRARRRRAILARPFPEAWRTILERDVAHYHWLTPEQQVRLRDHVLVLAETFTFEGANGLVVTDRMRVIVSAGVALLMMRDTHDDFRRVTSVILYPEAFRRDEGDGLLVVEQVEVSGEAHDRGPVILSWPQTLEESRDPSLGYHLVVHEFAHQLDFLDGEPDGLPPLPDAQAESRWRGAFTAALERHLAASVTGDSLFSDGATDPVEFFADVCELFVTAPDDLKHDEPEVYALLADYFALDFTAARPG